MTVPPVVHQMLLAMQLLGLRIEQCATKDCDASSFLRLIRSEDPSRDAFSLLKYMPLKGNLCKS